jgi:hypothetical protein
MDPNVGKTSENETPPHDDDRRKFLAACGRFAVITPPALTMLLSTSLTSKAITRSGGGGDGPGTEREKLIDWIERLLKNLF